MADSREFAQRCAKVGATIRGLREALGMERAELARKLGLSLTAVQRIESGESTVQFIKLAEIARTLSTTPNVILDVSDSAPDREIVMGLIQAALVSQGMPLEQARPLSRAVLRVLDSPDTRNSGMPLEDTARTIGLFALRQALNE